jgi:integrase
MNESVQAAVERPKRTKKEELPRGIRRRGRSLLIYLTHPDGHVELRSLGMVSVKFAESQRTIFQREIAEGRYLKPAPRVERVLFSEIADKALKHAENYKRFWDSDTSRVNRLKGWWGDRFADSITTEEIEEKFLGNMAPRGLAWCETTSNEYCVFLSHIYKLAIDAGKLSANPAATAHRYRLENARDRELSFEEEARLREAIREDYPAKEVEFDLALHTGVRKSNLYGTHGSKRKYMAPLDWSNVNLNWKVMTLPRSKGGKGYTMPLNDVAMAALKILRERGDGTGTVIRKPSGLELGSCRKWFEACLKKAAIPNFCYHDLRHTFASRLRSNKVPIEDIAELLGHNLNKYRMTLRYARPDLDRLHEAVATLVQTGTKTDTGSVVAISAVKSA